MNRIIVCGSTCGHNHDSLNGPTGCCAEHGPYMYFCGECHDVVRVALDPERTAPAEQAAAEQAGESDEETQ